MSNEEKLEPIDFQPPGAHTRMKFHSVEPTLACSYLQNCRLLPQMHPNWPTLPTCMLVTKSHGERL